MNKVVVGLCLLAFVNAACGSDADGDGMPDTGGTLHPDVSVADSGDGDDVVTQPDSVGDSEAETDVIDSNWGTIVAVDGIGVDKFVSVNTPVIDLGRNETNVVCTRDGLYTISDDGAVSEPLILAATCSRVDFRGLLYVTDVDGAVHHVKLQPAMSISKSYLGLGTEYRARSATGNATDIYVAAGAAGLLHVDAVSGAVSPLDMAFGAVDVVQLVGDDDVFAVATATGVSIVDVGAKTEKKVDIWGGTWRVTVVWPSPELSLVAAGPLGAQFVRLDAQHTPTLAGAAVGRGVPLDVAAYKGCALAAEWNNVARYGCTEEIAWVFGEELWGLGGEQTARSHVSAIETDANGTIVVGTELGLAWLTMGNTATGPDAYFATNRLDFRGVAVGDSQSLGVILANDGDAPLLVKSISLDNPAFSIEIDPDFAGDVGGWSPLPLMVVEAHSALGFFEVRYRPESEAMVGTTLRIETNDLDEPIIEVPVWGNSKNLAPGDNAPHLWLPSLDNERAALSSLTGTVHYIKFFNGL